jgi:threonine dehydratase
MLTVQDIEDARHAIRRWIKRTPVVRSRFLSNRCNGEVYLKLENTQITNSFKIRGALTKMLNMSPEQLGRGVVTASAGNHGLAVAFGAQKLATHATIILPTRTPQVKVDKIRAHNPTLILHGSVYDEAEQKAQDLATNECLTYISPYNDQLVIAGQGTIGLEILERVADVDTILVPLGGGGLISGMAIAVKSIKPLVTIVGVQSKASPVMYESLKAGKIVDVPIKDSIADGLHGGVEKGTITLRIITAYVNHVLLVRERTIRRAIYLLWENERQVVEGAGAASIAPILENPAMFRGKTTVAVISGGNIDDNQFQKILASEKESPS